MFFHFRVRPQPALLQGPLQGEGQRQETLRILPHYTQHAEGIEQGKSILIESNLT
jgi:hypothetical protein